jgi:hypothetical protein
VDELRAVLEETGLSGAEIRMTEIGDEGQARERRFVGSPTVLIDGKDVAPAGEGEVGLNCRIYRRREGRVSPTPDPEDLREALLRAMGSVRQEVNR